MDYDLCTTPYKHLADAWNMFVDTGTFHKGMPRPDAYTSWIRCRRENMNNPNPLSEYELANKQENNNRLIANARPIMNGIKNILAREQMINYSVFLMDAEGLIIDSDKRGDVPIIKSNEEICACYNAIDISSHEKKVLEVYDYEYRYPTATDWHTIGDQISNYDKSIAGGLGIVCGVNRVSSIVPIVKIGSQLIRSSIVYEQIARNNITMLLEEIPEAVIAINGSGVIMNVNQGAVDYLYLPREKLIGERISNYLLGNVDYNQLYSHSQGFNVFSDISIRGRSAVNNTVMKKSIIGNYDGHPLILLTFNTKQFKSVGFHSSLANSQYYCFDDLIGESQPITFVKNIASRAAASHASVLVEGESGTGKELIAQSIHSASRPQGPFIALNCGALTKELLQSELFGYEEGAFTGAKKGGKPGKFEIADGGTLFLDEIGEMPMDMQVSLLRCIQEKSVTRVGGAEPKKVDLRIIAATNQNLFKQVKEGSFREDLYYRLNVIEIKMPPLRERMADLPLLTSSLIKQLREEHGSTTAIQITEEAMDCLKHYAWPGNVRELRNVLERAIIYSDGREINEECLPEHIREGKPRSEGSDILKDYEKMAIIEVLTKHKGNITKSAEELGMARSTLYQKMEKLNIPH